MKKNLAYIIVIIAICCNTDLCQPVLRVFPIETYLNLYESGEIFVRVENIEGFRAYSVSLSYDSQKLRCLSILRGDFFLNWNTFFFTLIDSNANLLTVDEAILGIGYENGSGDLFKVRFQALSEGDVDINIVSTDLRDTLNNVIEVQIQNGVIHILNPSLIEDIKDNEVIDRPMAYPNPFNSTTRVEFTSNENYEAEFAIYSIIGKKVFSFESQSATNSSHSFFWDGKDSSGNILPSGIYFFTAKSKDEIKTFKLVLLK